MIDDVSQRHVENMRYIFLKFAFILKIYLVPRIDEQRS